MPMAMNLYILTGNIRGINREEWREFTCLYRGLGLGLGRGRGLCQYP